MTVADNYTEYRSEEGSTRDLDPEHILLSFYENEGKKVLNSSVFLPKYLIRSKFHCFR